MAEYTRTAAVRVKLFDIAVELFEPEAGAVQVTFGHPGTTILDDCVSIMDIEATQQSGPQGGRRSRDEDFTATVIVSVWRAGGAEMERIAFDRAYEIVGVLENHIRKVDPRLGNTVEWCFLTEILAEGTPPDLISSGRLTTITVKFSGNARIRND